MQRWDIINHFIKKNNYRSYLEIGYYKGWSFDKVECDIKVAVDPNPSKTFTQEELKHGGSDLIWKKLEDDLMQFSGLIWKKTSDEFFSEIDPEDKYDIIFIDGLHEAEQLKRDVENSLKHLADGGMIVLHDMNPPKYEHTTTGIDGCWTGDCYKVLLQEEVDFDFYVIDTDWGVGIINPLPKPYVSNINIGPLDYEMAKTDWDYFDKNRKDLLNLITVDEFKRKENINNAIQNILESSKS